MKLHTLITPVTILLSTVNAVTSNRSFSIIPGRPYYLIDANQTNMKWMINYYSYGSIIPSRSDVIQNSKFPTFGISTNGFVEGYIDILDVVYIIGSSKSSDLAETTPLNDVGGLWLLICSLEEWSNVVKDAVYTKVQSICPQKAVESEGGCVGRFALSGGPGRKSISFSSDGEQSLTVVLISCHVSTVVLQIESFISLTNPTILPLDQMSELPSFLLPLMLFYLTLLVLWLMCLIAWTVLSRKLFHIPMHKLILVSFVLRAFWYAVNILLWSQLSNYGNASTAVIVFQTILRFLTFASFILVLALFSKGLSIQVTVLPYHDMFALTLLTIFYASAETIYEYYVMFGSTGEGISVLFASWVMTIVYLEHCIRAGASTTVYANEHVQKILKVKPTSSAYKMYSMEADSQCSIKGLALVYNKKVSMQRSIWLLMIVYGALRIVVECMRFFAFISYIPFLYLLLIELTDLLTTMRLAWIIQSIHEGQQVKL